MGFNHGLAVSICFEGVHSVYNGLIMVLAVSICFEGVHSVYNGLIMALAVSICFEGNRIYLVAFLQQ